MIWGDAEGRNRELVDITYDYDAWFPRIQELVSEASMAAKGYPAAALDWFAELGAGQESESPHAVGYVPGGDQEDRIPAGFAIHPVAE